MLWIDATGSSGRLLGRPAGTAVTQHLADHGVDLQRRNSPTSRSS
jgi:hypothetical protein